MGLRLPQLTEVERDNNLALAGNSFANGLTIYNSTRNCVQYWNGSGWIDMGTCGVVIHSYGGKNKTYKKQTYKALIIRQI
ncbi:MAG: hypothetical protein LBT04_07205 [Prevotellaceae bacterium]|nr:hypothetical protein [Prevotellaceae bacterium]